jgi:riboflavin synthase
MFSGIIEATGTVVSLTREQENLHIAVRAPFTHELKIDQSIAHNGACLTVVDIKGDTYTVTAIAETLNKTSLGSLKEGDKINLERCVKAGDRLDGHIVQGHVDQKGKCAGVEEQGGSWLFTFEYDPSQGNITVEKGSVCVNGVSLTVVNSKENGFSVAIIPYTYEHTNFHALKPGDTVNLEFDILGKYITKLLQKQSRS